ncbi:hypothetical protein BDF20DRAFT_218787 [Mycotypha africana]|uniref:uncharacterized protein n=1 Tax=Mycotypha africana TaxID=64632 RepID=UPI002301914E|nr:uncharacterized protein BDF20DRAFT_218787 [Mycotypha africana]KAI8967510.1 hypothetical protein BDF20DRAFT_218787 [Mycotypha africana]
MTRKLKYIERTSTFAWSPSQAPMIATGTMADASDDSFFNVSSLEIFEMSNNASNQTLEPLAKVHVKSRFQTIGWGYISEDKPKGIIASGMKTGELELWDASAILDGKSADECLILRNSMHMSVLRSLDFNIFQTNLLATAGDRNEVYIWDLENPFKPYSPGARSVKMEHITDVAWNCQVKHILATSSSNGYAVVWDLRHKKEVMALPPTGQLNGGSPISSIAWHPDIATQIVTAINDNQNPIISLWDLRHAQSPEKILNGHTKGVLDVSWCQQDSGLLTSSGQDCRTLCWNPNTGELDGEITRKSKWTFEIEWCPRNPDLLATASFDGNIDIYSIQGRLNPKEDSNKQSMHAFVPDNPSDAAMYDTTFINSNAISCPSFELKRAPKWLQRPVGASFGFGGKIVHHHQNCVKLSSVRKDPEIVQRSEQLESVSEEDLESYKQFVENRICNDDTNDQEWKVLRTLFSTNAREELIQCLGFEREEVTKTAYELIEKLRKKEEQQRRNEKSVHLNKQKQEDGADNDGNCNKSKDKEIRKLANQHHNSTDGTYKKRRGKISQTYTNDNSEINNTSAIKNEETPVDDTTLLTSAPTEAKLEKNNVIEKESVNNSITVSNLFNNEQESAVDGSIFSQINNQQGFDETTNQSVSDSTASTNHNFNGAGIITRIDFAPVSIDVNRTIGSSSHVGAMDERNPFKFYNDEILNGEGSFNNETDNFITKAIMLGDFESAVDVCLAAGRYSDALVFATCGGSELLSRTRRAYFKQQSKEHTYLRLLEGIVDEDLASIVKNADDIQHEWVSILVVLSTFAKAEDFGPLCEILGDRMLETKHQQSTAAAAIFYLVAGNLQKVCQLWINKLNHEDNADNRVTSNSYEMRLQELVEKVVIFRKAIEYEDKCLTASLGNLHENYSLAPLYEKYAEYVEYMASEGKLDVAIKYINLIPAQFINGNAVIRDRIAAIYDRINNVCGDGNDNQAQQRPSFSFEKKEIGNNNAASIDGLYNKQPTTSSHKQYRYSQQCFNSKFYQQSFQTNNRESFNVSSPAQQPIITDSVTSKQQYGLYNPQSNSDAATATATAEFTPEQYITLDNNNDSANYTHIQRQPQQLDSYISPTTYQQQQAIPSQKSAITASSNVSNATTSSSILPKAANTGTCNDPPMLMSPKITRSRKVSPANSSLERVTTPITSSPGSSLPSSYFQQAVNSAAANQQTTGGVLASSQSPLIKSTPSPSPINAEPPQAPRAFAANNGGFLLSTPQLFMANTKNSMVPQPTPSSSTSTIGTYCSARQQFQQPPPPSRNGIAPSPMLKTQSPNATAGTVAVPRPSPLTVVAPSPLLEKAKFKYAA